MGHHLLPVAVAIVAVVALLTPGAASYPWPVCGNTTFAPNSTYLANLNHLAATLPGNASTSASKLFARARAGAGRDRVWAAGLCRGDVNASDCFGCLAQAFHDLPNDCSYIRDATIFYDACVLRYSGARVLSAKDTDASGGSFVFTAGSNVTSEQGQFNSAVAALINATADHAARNSTRRFATGEARFNREVPNVYAVAQCTPGQTPVQCQTCLEGIITAKLGDCENNVGCRLLWLNCSFRYEIVPFFHGPAMVQLPSPFPAAPAPSVQPTVNARPLGGGGEPKGRKYDVPVVVPAVLLPVLVALNLGICLCLWMRRRKVAEPEKPDEAKHSSTESAEDVDVEMVDSMMMDVSTLRAATGDFDDSNKLGEGGFGAVYRGVLPDGEEVAVKRLSPSSRQGVKELKNELALVAKQKHKNLVRLVGICLEQQERLLVYEYVPNRSLDLVLFGAQNRLDWEQRYRIINGVAWGMQYLHEDSQLRVVHRDLKASNILLDADMNPKISDFGLARIFERDQMQAVTRHVMGTYGYMAPEYLLRGNYSVKSDVFSFGVIMLEILTGRRNNSEDLLKTVWENWEAGTVMELVDQSMNGSFPEGDLLRCFHVGLLCLHVDPAARPVISSVVVMLGGDTVALQAPSKPAWLQG